MSALKPITGETLIAWGHAPGPQFPALLAQAESAVANGRSLPEVQAELDALKPAPAPAPLELQSAADVPLHVTLEGGDEDEEQNLADVRATMREVMRTPTVAAAAIMPDACPAGPLGTIPVGGVVAAREAIHPGMHSADICCSVMMTDLGEVDPKAALDAAEAVTHFGPGGRRNGARFTTSLKLLDAFRENRFLSDHRTLRMAQEHMGTQGDGNHFLFIGRSRATGRVAMVTHHGSRGPGAMLHRAGMDCAQKWRKRLSPATRRQNAWIPAGTEDGAAYWQALQLIRKWTRANHNCLHQAVVEKLRAGEGERIWNEHNFVFRRGGLYYHGKGATPAWAGWAADASDRTLIPLNMAEPVLVVRGLDAAHGLGFAPHGAGRNFSRSEHRRRMGSLTPEAALRAETRGLDVRFAAGPVDASELPSSYKRAATVTAAMERHGLAEVVDHIDPYGCIMAGDVPPFWAKKGGGRR